MKEVNDLNCGRESDLIAFLYGELNDVEAQTFQRHVRDCVSCNAELVALGDVRQSVVAWRNESLGAISRPFNGPAPAGVRPQDRSAWAAVREFFNLAPLWMKGALAFASVLFCLFAGLAITRLRDNPRIVVVKDPGASSQQEVDAIVDRRVQEELMKQKSAQQSSTVVVENAPPRIPGRAAKRGSVAVIPYDKARRPLSRIEREQLAADLRLVSGKNESDLDLLDDRINQ